MLLTGDVCTATFSQVVSNGTLMAELTVLCDSVGDGDRLTKTLACLLDRQDKHKHHKYYRGIHSVIEKVLEERDMPVSIFIACAHYLKVQKVIDRIAEWHGPCSFCRQLYRR